MKTMKRNKANLPRKIAAFALAFMMLFTVSMNTLATAESTSYPVSFYLQDGTQHFTYPGETGLAVVTPAAPPASEGYIFAYWYQVDAALQGDANIPFDFNSLVAAPLLLKAFFMAQEPAVTEAPPVVTEAPPIVTAVPPVVTEAPPVVTEAPPVVTEAPPVVTEALPVVTEAPPIVTEAPLVMIEDHIFEEPLAEEPVAEEPVVEEPVAEEPVAEEPMAEEPAVTGEPVVTVEPDVTQDPVITEEPVLTDEPIVVEESAVTEEPVVTDEPIDTKEPVATEEPVAAGESAITNKLIVPEELVEETPALQQALLLPVGVIAFGENNLFLYSAPSADAEKIMKLDPATLVTIISQDELWALVDFQGTTGYISLSNLVMENPVVRSQPSVHIWFVNAPETIMDGDVLTLNAKLVGFEGLDYTIVWQRATMDGNRNVGNDWVDEYGANGLSHSYTVNRTTAFYAWRLAVTVTLPENVSFLEP